MVKRSRLRSGQRGKNKLIVFLVLAGLGLFLGHRFYTMHDGTGKNPVPKNDEYDTSDSLLDDRGTIFDRSYKELAVTLDRVSVYANVRDVDPEEVAEKLAPVFEIEPERMKRVIASESYRAWISKNITTEEEEAVRDLNLKGVHLHRERIRFYPEHETAAHVLGFVGKSIGLAGVEYRFNTLLNKYGVQREQPKAGINKNRSEFRQDEGQYLVLTLDLKIQEILEKFIKELGEKKQVEKIAAVLMECQTGKIIGAAEYPSFDPNRFEDYNWNVLESILAKPIIVSEKVRELLWDSSLLQSRYETHKTTLPWSVHSVPRSLGSQLRLWDRLGINDSLKIDFVADTKQALEQNVPDIHRMVANDFDSVTDKATPLHILSAVNDLMMGKSHVAPFVINELVKEDGTSIDLVKQTGEFTVDEKVAEEIRHLVNAQLVEGPISSGFFESSSMFYENLKNGRQYSNTDMVFSFIPKKKPKLVLFVSANLPIFFPSPSETKSRFELLESVKSIVLPLVALQEVRSNLSDMMSVEEKSKMNFELHREIHQAVIVNDIEKEAIYHEMPDLHGLSIRKSLRLLKDLKLEIQIHGTGVVVQQKPEAGERVKQGELCRLVLKPH